MPGLIDHATQAATIGGDTTIADMLL
ncbi:hypothetical protein X777_10235 [Ooceraea biroi]|uniref:Uncharacterized protein n=1 Tax=Ooceraea biroi TaxID=2015173 RepID=A0A026X5B9_OOCBI|nr:hypothetical protein X777_10235 [Ooceraea biroi]